MIDVHSHIIFDVDDGPSCMEQSLEMIREAVKLGINSIVASPHFQEPVFSLKNLDENYQELLYRTRDYGVDINLSYEVFIAPQNMFQANTVKKLKDYGSGIILFEFPFGSEPRRCIETIKNMDLQDVTPVIAHIERNRSFINDIASMVEFIKAGCFLQIDAASIAGIYGIKVKEFAKKLIQLKLVDMVASNAHCAEDYRKWYPSAYVNVVRWGGAEAAEALFHSNAMSILNNSSEDKRRRHKNMFCSARNCVSDLSISSIR